MPSKKQYNLVHNDEYDTRIPLHSEEAFHRGIIFHAKVRVYRLGWFSTQGIDTRRRRPYSAPYRKPHNIPHCSLLFREDPPTCVSPLLGAMHEEKMIYQILYLLTIAGKCDATSSEACFTKNKSFIGNRSRYAFRFAKLHPRSDLIPKKSIVFFLERHYFVRV